MIVEAWLSCCWGFAAPQSVSCSHCLFWDSSVCSALRSLGGDEAHLVESVLSGVRPPRFGFSVCHLRGVTLDKFLASFLYLHNRTPTQPVKQSVLHVVA